mgnify:FL=1
MIRFLLVLAALLCASSAWAQGPAGDPKDRLDHPGAPTDRYLDPGEIRDVLHGVTDGFYGCFRSHARGTRDVGDVAVTFKVGGSGAVEGAIAEIGGAPEALGPCLVELLGTLEFAAHDGDPVEVSYPLVYQVDQRGARVLPYPVVFTKPRPVRLPLLSVPLDVAPGELTMLERILVAPAEEIRADQEEQQEDASPPSPAGDEAPAER